MEISIVYRKTEFEPMGIDENNRINFVSFDAKSLDLQKKAVAHLKSDLVD